MVDFNEETLKEVRDAKPAPLEGRETVRGYTIDSEMTWVHDDALWGITDPESVTFYVSTIDLSHAVPKGSFRDQAAFERMITRMHGDGTSDHMLPPDLIREHITLSPNILRPTITASITLDTRTFDRIDGKIDLTQLCSRRRYSFSEATRIIRDGGYNYLNEWGHYADRIHKKRINAGNSNAVFGSRNSVAFRNAEHVHIRDQSELEAARVVAELNILFDIEAGNLMLEKNVPFLYYNHPEDAKRAYYSVDNGGFTPLNLPFFCRVTSPTWRYPDLVNQRQLVAAIKGEIPPYTRDTLMEIADKANDLRVLRRREMLRHQDLARLHANIAENGSGAIQHMRPKDIGLLLDDVVTHSSSQRMRVSNTHGDINTVVTSLESYDDADEVIVSALTTQLRSRKISYASATELLFSPPEKVGLDPLKQAVLGRLEDGDFYYAVGLVKTAKENGADIKLDTFVLPGEELNYLVRYRLWREEDEEWVCGTTIPNLSASHHMARQLGAVAFLRDLVEGNLAASWPIDNSGNPAEPYSQQEQKLIDFDQKIGKFAIEAYRKGWRVNTNLGYMADESLEPRIKLALGMPTAAREISVSSSAPNYPQAYRNALGALERKLKSPRNAAKPALA